jgi:hypothetical protein
MKANLLHTIIASLLMQLMSEKSNAQWSTNPAVNNAITVAANDQSGCVAVSDGLGGAIISWTDSRNGANTDIYAQRIDANGVVQWAVDGVAICTASDVQNSVAIVSDGSGGAIISWRDLRSGTNTDIYSQRINQAGLIQWATNGVAICTAVNDQTAPAISADDNGGAFYTWAEVRTGAFTDIYAQHVDASGSVQWTPDGVVVCAAQSDQDVPKPISDGSGGAIITWQDRRNATFSDIYAQRINASGTMQWATDGIVVCSASNSQINPSIVSNGSGGAVISWMDLRSLNDYDIYLQRVNAAGVVQWTSNGVAVAAAVGDQQNEVMVADGAGGITIVWEDGRSGTNFDIYAQRVNAAGAVQWTGNGTAICTALENQQRPDVVNDGEGGVIICWQDSRVPTNMDIYAQRVNANGAGQWLTDGLIVSSAIEAQRFPVAVSDGKGGAIVTWNDIRSNEDDIYAQRINPDGVLCTDPVVNLGTDTIKCGGTVLLDAGNAGGSYLWNNAALTQTLLATISGVYSVRVTNVSGCYSSDTINVTIHALPNVTYSEVQASVCIGEPSFTLTAASPPGGSYGGTAVTGNTFNPSVAGAGTFSIVYTFTDSNTCTNSASSAIDVDLCSSIQNIDEVNAIRIYPNPISSTATLQTPRALTDGDLTIYDIYGKTVLCLTGLQGQSIELPVRHLLPGVYFCQVIQDGRLLGASKVVVTD